MWNNLLKTISLTVNGESQMNLENLIGVVGHAEDKIEDKNTSVLRNTGALPVYSFSELIYLMEKSACSAVQDFLPLGTSTVATNISVRQISATLPGHHVQAEATVTGVEGKKIFFRIVAFDEKGKIGEASHERFVVFASSFMDKISKKNIS